MPDPSTTRLALYKSKSDGSEDVNYTQDIGQNWDKVDQAVGALACTSTTRPSTPWNGQLIRETDTGRMWVSNGSAPASGSWKEISTPATVQTFTAGIALTRTNTTDIAIATATTAAAQRMFGIGADGTLNWGTGAATEDTNLYRSAVNTLKTDDSLVVTGDLTVGGIGQILLARKSADTARTATTGSNDPHLNFTLAASATYTIEGEVYASASATTAAVLIDWTIPSGAAGRWGSLGIDTTATLGTGTADKMRWVSTPFGGGARTFAGIISTSNAPPVKLSGVVRTSSAGTFALLWCVSTGPGTLTFLTDSYVKLTRVA